MTSFDHDFQRLYNAFDERIETFMRETAVAISPPGSSLLPMLDYHFSTGGKRLRAIVPLMVAECFEEDPARLLPLAAACEMLHNATLVHDDLQDEDRIRRDQPTIWVQYSPARAINLGDAMLYYTLACLHRLEVSDAQKQSLTERFLRDTLSVIDGQEREFLMQSAERVSMDDYMRMVEGKTSGLFALPIAGAAEVLGRSENEISTLRQAAVHLGVLFQIQDDVLDLYADKGRDRRGSDIAEGKRSFLVVYALEHASPQKVSWLQSLLEKERSAIRNEEIEEAIDFLRECGALQASLQEIERRRSLALEAVGDHITGLIDGIAGVLLAPIAGIRP